uniref:Uncharacterized protein n=1 Tax=Cuerna arida TaxID=1464854 RepID=A0A1B6GUG6_9HEMI
MGCLSVIFMVFVSIYLITFIVYICESVWDYCEQMCQMNCHPDNTKEQEAQQNISKEYELFLIMCELLKIKVPECEHFQIMCEQSQLYLPDTFGEEDEELVGLLLHIIEQLYNDEPDITTGQAADEVEADKEIILWFKQLIEDAWMQCCPVTPTEDEKNPPEFDIPQIINE